MPPHTTTHAGQLELTQDQLARLHEGQAASRASSQGTLMLDPASLSHLEAHFRRVMAGIEQRMDQLAEQSRKASVAMESTARLSMQLADEQIARYERLDSYMDELEHEFATITQIKEIVRENRRQLEELERRFKDEAYEASRRSGRSHHSSRHR